MLLHIQASLLAQAACLATCLALRLSSVQGHAARGRKAVPAHELMQCHTMARVLTRSRVLPAAGETIPASDSEGDGGEAEGVFEGPHRERELFVLHQLARTYGTSPAVVEAVAEEYNVDDGEPLLWDVGPDSAAPTGLHCWSSPAVGEAYHSKDLM